MENSETPLASFIKEYSLVKVICIEMSDICGSGDTILWSGI